MTFTAGDVADPDFFAKVTQEAGADLGGLVYAVGTINLRPLAKLTLADVEADFRINALGAFLAVQAAVPALRPPPGRPGSASSCSRRWR